MPIRSDPTAHFNQYGATVTVGDNIFTVPPVPASVWLSILTDEQVNGAQILPGMLDPDEQETMDQLLLDGELTVAELKDLIQDVITTVSGHPWWWTLGLLSVLRGESGTETLGTMAYLDADKVSFGHWLNALYARWVKYMKEHDRVQFDTQLDTPPAEVELDPADVINEDTATAAFFGMMNQPNG